MGCFYWFNRKDLLQKTHEKYHNKGGKEKDVEYYLKKQRNDKKERKK